MKRKNTLVKGMRVGNLIAGKKAKSLLSRKNELREHLLRWWRLLQHKICSELGDKAQPDPHIRHTFHF